MSDAAVRRVPGRDYAQAQRGARYAPWHPLISLLTMSGAVIGVVGVFWFVAFLLVSGRSDVPRTGDVGQGLIERFPVQVLLGNNLLLACGIPAAMAAIGLGFWVRPGTVSSVTGRFRWRFAALALGVAVLMSGAAMVVLNVIGGPRGPGRDSYWWMLLLVALFTTPLQAAGEEYFFRGWLTQTLGAWIRPRLAGNLIPALISGLLFAFAHGQQDLWLFCDRLVFALFASYLVWRTGGLEAAVAVHAANNLVVLTNVALTGGLAEALVPRQAPPGLVVVDLAGFILLALALVALADRMRLARHTPAADVAGDAGFDVTRATDCWPHAPAGEPPAAGSKPIGSSDDGPVR